MNHGEQNRCGGGWGENEKGVSETLRHDKSSNIPRSGIPVREKKENRIKVIFGEEV